MRTANQPSKHSGFQAKLEIAGDLLQRFPNLGVVVEESTMFGLTEIEIVGWGKHSVRA
jgi:hypothetical protein